MASWIASSSLSTKSFKIGVCFLAKPKKMNVDTCGAPPATLDGHPFYGLALDDDEQIAFRDALWDPNVRFCAVDACAGSGKTTLVMAVACLLYHYGRIDGVTYLRIPTASSEGRVGFLPGTLASRVERPYDGAMFQGPFRLSSATPRRQI